MIATILFFLCSCIVFLNPDIAINAVYDTLKLCTQAVIPSLFPYFVITNLWISTGGAYKLSQRIGIMVETIFHLPKNLSHALLIGCISGFPLGANAVLQQYNDNKIMRDHAEQALMFCSNAGPGYTIISLVFPFRL